MRNGFILTQRIAGVTWYYMHAKNGKKRRMDNTFDIRLVKFYKTNIRAHMQARELGDGWEVIPFKD